MQFGECFLKHIFFGRWLQEQDMFQGFGLLLAAWWIPNALRVFSACARWSKSRYHQWFLRHGMFPPLPSGSGNLVSPRLAKAVSGRLGGAMVAGWVEGNFLLGRHLRPAGLPVGREWSR